MADFFTDVVAGAYTVFKGGVLFLLALFSRLARFACENPDAVQIRGA